MKLTDEKVARALGWRWHWKCGTKWTPKNPRKMRVLSRAGDYDRLDIPAYTSSLDAIVAEVKARGLWWTMTAETSKGWAQADVGEFLRRSGDKVGDTPALALCAALLAFLKETR